MAENTAQQAIQRILVALDASEHSLGALEVAAHLAARLGAELSGLFVEDIVLSESVKLPFTRQTTFFSSGPREINTDRLEKQFKRQATRAREAIERQAEQVQVQWSFRVVRGQVHDELCLACEPVDLVSLGHMGWSPTLRQQLGSTAQAFLQEGMPRVLLSQRDSSLGQSIFVLCEESVEIPKLLQTASQLSRAEGLLVLLFWQTEEILETLRAQAKNWLETHKQEAMFQLIPTKRPQTLLRLLKEQEAGLLLLSRRSPTLQQADFRAFLGRSTCPILCI